MQISTFNVMLVLELILVLIALVAFLFLRLRKIKRTAINVDENAFSDFEIYLQYLNRELTDTKAHLDTLYENESDDIETIKMYEYRLKHLVAEHDAMKESKGEVMRFWELYHANIDFIYAEEAAEETTEVTENIEEPAEISAVESVPVSDVVPEEMLPIQDQFDEVKSKSTTALAQNNEVIELVQKIAVKTDSEELKHMLSILTDEKLKLEHELHLMQQEFEKLMKNASYLSQQASGDMVSGDDTEITTDFKDHYEQDDIKALMNKQNKRVIELNNVIGDLTLELEDKERLSNEVQRLEQQMKEMGHVIIIMEDENEFLRDQINALLQDA